jgi:hypothetical protein
MYDQIFTNFSQLGHVKKNTGKFGPGGKVFTISINLSNGILISETLNIHNKKGPLQVYDYIFFWLTFQYKHQLPMSLFGNLHPFSGRLSTAPR